MRYYITIPFGVRTYKKILDNYWSGKEEHNGSLGYFKKTDKSSVKKYHKYFFGGRVPVNCIDYTPPFHLGLMPRFDNFFTDWQPLYIDDMMMVFSQGESERMCSKYIYIVDELEDNEIITWTENGKRMIGAFNAMTGNTSVAITWTVGPKERRQNTKKAEKDYSPDKMIRAEQPKLIMNKQINIDPRSGKDAEPVNWYSGSKDDGIRGIGFAVTIERMVLGDLVEKRIKSLRISLTKYLRANNITKATELGNLINRLSIVLKNCRDPYYRF